MGGRQREKGRKKTENPTLNLARILKKMHRSQDLKEHPKVKRSGMSAFLQPGGGRKSRPSFGACRARVRLSAWCK